MLFPQSFRVWAIAGLCMLLGVGVSQAQQWRGQQRPMPQQGAPLNVKGTIVAIGSGSVKVLSNNATMLFAIAPAAQIKVTGTAELDYLRPHVYIQFTAEAEKETGIVKEPVGKLTIASPPATPPAEKKHGKPADTGLNGLNADTLAPGTIGGHITSIKVNKVTVKPIARGKPITFELTDTPVIDVNSTDITLAKNGDTIDLQGTKFPQGNGGMINTATITLAQPLTGTHKKKPAAKPKKSDEEPAAEPAK